MLDTIRDCILKGIIAVVALLASALIFGLETAMNLLVVGILLWVAGRVWSLLRLWRSVAASKGDERAMALEKLRFQSSLYKLLCNIVLVASFCLVAWLCMSGGIRADFSLLIALVAAIICGAPIWGKASRCWQQYEKGFKSGFVASSLTDVFDNLKYDPNGVFNQSELKELDFFTHFDRYSGNDLIEAEYRGIRFVQGDVNVQEHYTVTSSDSKGNTRVSHRWRTVFFGRAMRFDFVDAFRGPVQVVQKDFAGAKVRSSGEWQRVETELAEFALDFDIFARDPLDAMAALTPMMVEGIFYLYHKLACPMAFYFTGNAMFVVFPLKRDTFNVSAGRTLKEEREYLERDVSTVTGFLDTMYFKRQVASEADAGTVRDAAPTPNRGEFVPSPAVEAARLKRAVSAGVWTTSRIVSYVVFGAYILSLLYALFALSDGIALGFSYSGGEFTLHEATFSIYVYVFLINGFFVLPPTAAACFRARSVVASVVTLIPMAIHFLVLYFNVINR